MCGHSIDYLVDMDVTVPLKDPSDIDGAVETARNDVSVDLVITAYASERNPYFNMVEINHRGFAQVVKRPDTPLVRRQDAPAVYSLSPAVYVVKRSALREFTHWTQARCKLYPIPRERALDIDTETDFRIIESLLKLQNERKSV
jgi:N-acylneuraminate cytidylyltransferase/CMP-N,N'-diacetyllegionaminic acid synthase